MHWFCVYAAHPEVLNNEMQNVDQLWDSVSLLHNDFARPVGQHLVAVLHACRNSWGKDGHGLAYNGTRLHGVGLEKAVKDLGAEGQTQTQKAIQKLGCFCIRFQVEEILQYLI